MDSKFDRDAYLSNILDGPDSHARIWSTEFSENGFSNHFPMALIALERLGADDATLRAFGNNPVGLDKKESDGLRPATVALMNESDFVARLGVGDSHDGYFEYFVDRMGAGVSLPNIDQLIPGLAASAFHGLIRLAYGLEVSSQTETATGLAIIADRFLAPMPLTGDLTEAGPGVFLSKVKSIFEEHLAGRFPVSNSQLNISGRIMFLARQSAPREQIADLLAQGVPSLDEIAEASLFIFLKSNNFTALHAVTATHAACVVANHLKDTRPLRYALATGILFAGLTIPHDEFSSPSAADAPVPAADALETIQRIKDSAITSSEEHKLKISWTCIEQYRRYNDARYLDAALNWLKA